MGTKDKEKEEKTVAVGIFDDAIAKAPPKINIGEDVSGAQRFAGIIVEVPHATRSVLAIHIPMNADDPAAKSFRSRQTVTVTITPEE